jgi:hypothetical protein
MNLNDRIEIEKVGNGFVVRPGYQGDRCYMIASADVFVFNDLASLGIWLGQHFPAK